MSVKVTTIGVDIFLVQKEIPQAPKDFESMKLKLISNRGTKVWPGTAPKIQMTDHYCCRYMAEKEVSSASITKLLQDLDSKGFHWVHVEKLLQFDGKNGFSDAQGE